MMFPTPEPIRTRRTHLEEPHRHLADTWFWVWVTGPSQHTPGTATPSQAMMAECNCPESCIRDHEHE